MTKLSEMRYCIEYETDEIKQDSDKIINRFINDLKYDKGNDLDCFTVYCKDDEYSLDKMYLWQKIITNYVLKEKKYKKVKFVINYTNLDMEIAKEYDSEILYPMDNVLCGQYCTKCIKRKECKELSNTFMTDIVYPEIKNDAQLYGTLGIVQSKKKALELVEDEIKDKLYEKIAQNNGKLKIKEFGIQLERKEIEKDTLTYSEALKLDLVDDNTVTVKVGEIKKKIKSNKTNIATIPFVKTPFRKELVVSNIKIEQK
jgi:hypothetical protein